MRVRVSESESESERERERGIQNSKPVFDGRNNGPHRTCDHVTIHTIL